MLGLRKEDLLGIPKEERKAFIKKAYLNRAREVHPDKGGSTSEFQKLGSAKVFLIGGKIH